MTFDYLIFAGGRPPALSFIKQLAKISKNVVTVDRGASLALKLNLNPILHVGDGDSFSASKLKKLKPSATIKLSPRKPLSDLEFALNHLDPSKTKLVIGAHQDSEGRSDHAFMNLLILSHGENLFFADEKMWATRLVPRKVFSFSSPKNSIFSVACFNQRKTKVSISGSAYTVKSKIFEHSTQGLSNLTRSRWTHIKVSRSSLLFVASNLLYTTVDDSSLI